MVAPSFELGAALRTSLDPSPPLAGVAGALAVRVLLLELL
jgi:hypothetical protein